MTVLSGVWLSLKYYTDLSFTVKLEKICMYFILFTYCKHITLRNLVEVTYYIQVFINWLLSKLEYIEQLQLDFSEAICLQDFFK